MFWLPLPEVFVASWWLVLARHLPLTVQGCPWRCRRPRQRRLHASQGRMDPAVPVGHALEVTRKVRWGAGQACGESGAVPQL